jgi:hypothetical protein
VDAAFPALTEMPAPQFVMSAEGHRIATYSWGDDDAPTVLCVHGFASSCRDNWVNTGWVRDLTRGGFRVLGVDQRGHGASDKPHEPEAYGGIPDGRPLARLQIEQARAYAEHGTPVEDQVTRNYVTLAERVPGNDLRALVALAEGMRLGDADPDPARPPQQTVLFATGSEDAILERSRGLAAATPHGEFVELPGRHHFNAPGSRDFRRAALEFFGSAG